MSKTDMINRRKIVILDSDPHAGAWRCSQLAISGLDGICVTGIIELLSAVHQHDVDLAFIHLGAPECIMTDLPHIIRRISRGIYLPVIIATDDPTSQRCDLLECGADDVVSPSMEGDEILARITSLLRIKTLHDELAVKQVKLEASLEHQRSLRTQLQRDNEQLRRLATTDSLTHVQNRRSFNDLLAREFHASKRYTNHLSLLMLDIDHFKVVNDQHGHPSGDYVLKELAVILRQNIRQSDIVARTGGEEFCVILPRASRQEARAFAQRIRRQVSIRKFIVYGESIHITISIGSATVPSNTEIETPSMLEYFTDQALLIAKENGRDRVVAVDDLDVSLRERLKRQFCTIEQ